MNLEFEPQFLLNVGFQTRGIQVLWQDIGSRTVGEFRQTAEFTTFINNLIYTYTLLLLLIMLYISV